jgi:hypothetical protein
MAQAAQLPLPPANEKTASGAGEVSYNVNVVIERKLAGKPHWRPPFWPRTFGARSIYFSQNSNFSAA